MSERERKHIRYLIVRYFPNCARVYLLSVLSALFLDGIFSAILYEFPPNSPFVLPAYIALSTFLRATLAEWLAVKRVWGSDKSKFSPWRLASAALIYGVPLSIISEYVFLPLRWVIYAFYMWLDKVVPITYVNSLVGIFLYVLIFDFSRLMLFLTISARAQD
jgi:hypothetical protein